MANMIRFSLSTSGREERTLYIGGKNVPEKSIKGF